MGAHLRIALVTYGLFVGLALLIGQVRGDLDLYRAKDPWISLAFPLGTLAALAAGAAVATATVAGTRFLVRRTAWARSLRDELRHLLGPLGSGEIPLLALASAVGEEVLFRGALQPWLGLWATGALFGAVHLPMRRRMVPWTLWAVVMGWVFGLLFQATGELAAPICAHALINDRNLRLIAGPRRER